MRPAVVSPLLLLAACSGGGQEAVFVDNLVERSPSLVCEVADLGSPPAAVSRLRAMNDSLLVAIAGGDRDILLLDDDLRVLTRIHWEKDGPVSLSDPSDAVLVGDSLLVIADRERARLAFLDLGGGDRGSLPLGFAPHRLLRFGRGYLVSAIALLPAQAELLYQVSDTSIRALGIPPLQVPDWQLKAMGNATVLEPVGGGRVILGHQFIEPVAHLLDVSAEGDPSTVRQVGVPLPGGVRGAVGYLPERPFTDESLSKLLAPMLDAASDTVAGEILYLTRTGRRIGDHWEKALVRADRDLGYLDSFVLPVNAGRFAYLPRRHEIIAVAEDERWYRCPLAPRSGS